MKRLFACLLCFSLCLSPGCGPNSNSQQVETDASKSTEKSEQPSPTVPDNHEILIGEICTHVAKLYSVVEGITDKASAESVVEEVATFQTQGNSLTNRLEALSDAPEDEAKRLEEKYGDQLAELTRQIKEINNIGRKFPVLGKALEGAVPIF